MLSVFSSFSEADAMRRRDLGAFVHRDTSPWPAAARAALLEPGKVSVKA